MTSARSALHRRNIGFLLAQASHRWNALLYERFCAAGWPQVRPAFGAILVPLFEDDGLRMSELAGRAGLSKQTMTTMVRELEAANLVRRIPDPQDGRAALVLLTADAKRFRPVAERAVAALETAVLALGPRQSAVRLRAWLGAVAELEGPFVSSLVDT
jgi:DNA-binding MarR family transcriptional regulator